MSRTRLCRVPAFLSDFFRSERGSTAIEYALVASLISVAILLAVIAIGQSLSGTFTNVASNLK